MADEILEETNPIVNEEKAAIADTAESLVSHEVMVRLRGLPYTVSHDEIRAFFEGIEVTDIKMASSRDGRPSGECYCYLTSKESVEKAVNSLNRKEMSQRYIEVFSVSSHEAEGLRLPGSVIAHGLSSSAEGGGNDRIIRLRGLPFSATEDDVRNFLTGLTCDEVVIGQTGGRPSGEAFVRLGGPEQAQAALELNRKTMGTRYIEVFRTDESDLIRHRDFGGGYPPEPRHKHGNSRPPALMSIETRNEGSGGYGGRGDYDYGYGGGGRGDYGGPVYPSRSRPSRSGPYDRRGGYDSGGYGGGYGSYGGGRGGGGDSEVFRNPNNVFMRGIPFDCSGSEIERFFAPLACFNIKIGYNREGRPSGDAVVEFEPHEISNAFTRNKQYMGRRYVELFGGRDAPPPMRSLSWKDLSGGKPAPPPPHRSSSGGYGASYGSAPPPDYYGAQSGYGGGYQASYADYKGYSNGGYGSSAGYGSAPPAGYGSARPADYGSAPSSGYGSAPPAGYGNAPPAGYGGSYRAQAAPTAAVPPPPPPPPRDNYGGAAYDRGGYY